MSIRNYFRTDCPVCGCKDARRNWNDEYGYDYHECDICVGCDDLNDLANKLKAFDFLKEAYLDGITKESELKEIFADELFGTVPWVDAERLANQIVELLYDEVAMEAEAENENAAEFSSEYLDALGGRY